MFCVEKVGGFNKNINKEKRNHGLGRVSVSAYLLIGGRE